MSAAATAGESPLRLRLALAGGGTGGHVLPGLHLLEHERLRACLGDVLWLGSGRRAELEALRGWESLVRPCPAEYVALALEPRGGGAPSRAWLAARTPLAFARARRALRAHGSQVLLGLGGFACLPAVLAAASLGVRIALLEINAAAGTATRVLGRIADRVLHAWPDSLPHGASEGTGGYPRHVVTGPPLGPRFSRGGPSERQRAEARALLGFDAGRPLLVVLGGSQGAGALNRWVRDHDSRLQAGGLQVLHQVGPGRSGESASPREGYRAVEYEREMDRVLTAATAVLCRAGASTWPR